MDADVLAWMLMAVHDGLAVYDLMMTGSRSKGIAKSPYLGVQYALPLDVARILQSEPSTPRNPKEPPLGIKP